MAGWKTWIIKKIGCLTRTGRLPLIQGIIFENPINDRPLGGAEMPF